MIHKDDVIDKNKIKEFVKSNKNKINSDAKKIEAALQENTTNKKGKS